MLTFTDSLNSEYIFTFNSPGPGIFKREKQSCTIVVYLDGWKNMRYSPAICSLEYEDEIIIKAQFEKNWTDEYFSLEAQDFLNKIITMKAFM